MTAMEQATERAVKEITDFEREVRVMITRDGAPAGIEGLAEKAQETRDHLIELSGEGIELELTDALRQQLESHLLAAIRNLTRFVKSPDHDARLEHAVDALIDLEATRHILRDGIDHEPLRSTDDSGHVLLTRSDAVSHIERWLPRLGREQQASLLGIDARDISRWKGEYAAKPASRQAEMAIELVGVLRHSWTDEGVARWFTRSHPQLDGQRPLDVIEDPDWEQRLLEAARIGRAQTAA